MFSLSKIKYISKDSVLTGTLIVTVGIFIGSFFSYLLQFVLGRLLTVSDYGTFNALLAIANIVGVPGIVFTTSIIKISAELKAKEQYNKLTHIYWKLSWLTLLFGLSLFLIFSIFNRQLSENLNFSDTFIMIPFGVYIGLSFLMTVPFAYLQGLLKFKAYAFSNILGGIIRFGAPVILVILGFGVRGVFYGLAISFLLIYLFSTLILKKDFINYEKEKVNHIFKRILLFSLPVLLINLGMMLLNNIDIILVKRFFSESIAGYYAGTVTIGKILLFGAGTVAVVMFPQISSDCSKGVDYSKKFKNFLLLQLLLVAGGTAIFALFPRLITLVLFGSKFLPSVDMLPQFSIFVALYVLINFMIMYFLAIGKTKVYLFQLPAIAAQYLLIVLFHNSLSQVIWINIAVAAFLLAAVLLYYVYDVSHRNRSSLQAGKNN